MPYKDPDVRRAYLKKWQQEHPEKRREYNRRNIEKNDPDGSKQRERARKYYHSEKRQRTVKRYYDTHREEISERRRKYYAENRERMKAASRKWRSEHREAYRKRKRRVFAAYGGKCACCGESHVEFLTIDHIDGGGTQHRKKLKVEGGAGIYRWLETNGFPDGFRVLCWNCNCAIGIHGYCPHEKNGRN